MLASLTLTLTKAQIESDARASQAAQGMAAVLLKTVPTVDSVDVFDAEDVPIGHFGR